MSQEVPLRSPAFVVLALLSLALAIPGTARAQDAVKLEVIKKGQAGVGYPAIVVLPQQDLADLAVRVDCGKTSAQRNGAASAGSRVSLELKVPPGTWDCKGTLRIVGTDGSEGEMPLKFQVALVGGMQITVPREKVDMAGRKLELVLDRPGRLVETTVYGEGGRELGKGITPIEGTPANTPVQVEWSAQPGDVFRIHLQVTDTDNLWAALDLFPWHYEIPHEDVEFASNEAVIRPGEEPKLVSALQEAFTVMGRFQMVDVPMNLYVGGYTDTVGDRSYNQALSQRRAEAIARWYRQKGFKGPIYFQGFGEAGQKVPTPDEVDEVRNRRAVYVLAAEAPAYSGDFPGTNWKKLP